MSNMSISYIYFLIKKQLWLVFAIQTNGLSSLSLSFSFILIKNWYLKIYVYNLACFSTLQGSKLARLPHPESVFEVLLINCP
jgi:hypothetical protein